MTTVTRTFASDYEYDSSAAKEIIDRLCNEIGNRAPCRAVYNAQHASFFVESHHSDVTLIEKTLHRIESSVIEYAKRTGDKRVTRIPGTYLDEDWDQGSTHSVSQHEDLLIDIASVAPVADAGHYWRANAATHLEVIFPPEVLNELRNLTASTLSLQHDINGVLISGVDSADAERIKKRLDSIEKYQKYRVDTDYVEVEGRQNVLIRAYKLENQPGYMVRRILVYGDIFKSLPAWASYACSHHDAYQRSFAANTYTPLPEMQAQRLDIWAGIPMPAYHLDKDSSAIPSLVAQSPPKPTSTGIEAWIPDPAQQYEKLDTATIHRQDSTAERAQHPVKRLPISRPIELIQDHAESNTANTEDDELIAFEELLGGTTTDSVYAIPDTLVPTDHAPDSAFDMLTLSPRDMLDIPADEHASVVPNLMDDEDDFVIERLEPPQPGPQVRRGTMRQRKGKGRSKAKVVAAAQSAMGLSVPSRVQPPIPMATPAMAQTNPTRPLVSSAMKAPATIPVVPNSLKLPRTIEQVRSSHPLLPSTPAIAATSTSVWHKSVPERDIPVTPVKTTEQHADSDRFARKLYEVVEATIPCRGRVSIQIDLGKALYRDPRKMSEITYNAASLEAALKHQHDQHVLVTALTSSRDDTNRVVEMLRGTRRMFSSSCVSSDSFYEIHLKEDPTIARICGKDIEHFTTGNAACMLIHYPNRVWDAACNMTCQKSVSPSSATCQLTESLHSQSGDPTLYWQHTGSSAAVSRILSKRVVRHETRHTGWLLQITEVQELEIEEYADPNNPKPDFAVTKCRARILDVKRAIVEQKIWYEIAFVQTETPAAFAQNAALELGEIATWSTNEVISREAIEDVKTMLDQFVPRLDGLGSGNQGPRGDDADLARIRMKRKDIETKREIENSGIW